jgi:hypothetical protein
VEFLTLADIATRIILGNQADPYFADNQIDETPCKRDLEREPGESLSSRGERLHTSAGMFDPPVVEVTAAITDRRELWI